jgi:hypothetical protein
MSSRVLAGGGALILALAVPQAAQALPTMAPLKPCYVTANTAQGPQSEPIEIVASGFTPNSSVAITIDGVAVPGGSAVQAGASGELAVAIPAPFVAESSKPFTLALTEVANPANTVPATAKSTALGVTVKPKKARPSRKIRFRGLGFTLDQPIWAHYLYKGKLRKTVRMARAPGECGSFEARKRQIPLKNPGLGRWTVQFDQSKQFVEPSVATPIVFVRLGIRLRRVPR